MFGVCFTDRHGIAYPEHCPLPGVSPAPYDELNLAIHVGDDPHNATHNRDIVASHLGVHNWVWMNQTHSDTVVNATEPGTLDADAIVTSVPQLALAVLTADCVPVLLTSNTMGAAVHAGRVGAEKGIVPKTVEYMLAHGARDVTAYIGACASGANYELSQEEAEYTESLLPGSLCHTQWGTPGVDIEQGIVNQLKRLRVANVFSLHTCTIASDKYFSFRRNGNTGRSAGIVWLKVNPDDDSTRTIIT